MKKSNLFLFILIGLVLSLYSCNSFSKAKQSRDIGCVIYEKQADGNLKAHWAYSTDDTTAVVGTGYTTENPNSQDFEGQYKITYTGTDTRFFNLIISKKVSANAQTYYRVEWRDIQTGQIDYYGTGIVKDNQLIVGWRE